MLNLSASILNMLCSKILYPHNSPTNEWQFCGLTSNVSITRSHRRLPDKLKQISSDRGHVGSFNNDAENTTSDAKIFQLSCQGEVGLFGRQHFIGIIPRAVRIIQTLPLETFGFNSDFNFIRYWIEYAGLTVLPLKEFTNMVNIIGLNITTGYNKRGKKYAYNLLAELNH